MTALVPPVPASPEEPTTGTGRPDCVHGGVAAACARGSYSHNGPIGRCGCCEMSYPYTDGVGGNSMYTWSRLWTPGLCAACGGHYVETTISRGVSSVAGTPCLRHGEPTFHTVPGNCS